MFFSILFNNILLWGKKCLTPPYIIWYDFQKSTNKPEFVIMKLEEFEIGISRKDNDCIITDIKHKKFYTIFYLMDDNDKKRIINTIVSYATGKINKLNFNTKVWTDGDYEEPSSDCYIAIKKSNGLLSDIINNIELLIGYLHDPLFDVYRIHVDDNLI